MKINNNKTLRAETLALNNKLSHALYTSKIMKIKILAKIKILNNKI